MTLDTKRRGQSGAGRKDVDKVALDEKTWTKWRWTNRRGQSDAGQIDVDKMALDEKMWTK